MSGTRAFILLSFLGYCSAFNIDVKTTNVILFNDGSSAASNGSLFGFSISLNNGKNFGSNVLDPSVFVGAPLGKRKDNGDFYQCHAKTKNCVLKQVDSSSRLSHQHVDKQWSGATVSSNADGGVAVCAPRYSEHVSASDEYYMIGKCTVLESDIDRLRLYPCTGIEANHPDQFPRQQNGFCLAGFSAALRVQTLSSKLVIGAVNAKSGQGTIFENKPGINSITYEIAPADSNNFGNYLGYSTTYGEFFRKGETAIAGGMPRFGISGKVNIYTEALTIIDSIRAPRKVADRNEYIYFGASVCAVDVNGDGYTDLIVGAPFFSSSGDEGRVYVYLSVESSGSGGNNERQLSAGNQDSEDDPGLKGSNTPGARFGWSIAKAGDLNNDRIDDFIVGAPQDQPDLDGDGFGNGAIYIYHGRKNGNIREYQQKITAETLKKFYPHFQQFGYAVTGNVDTNNDEYPDIAIGAWQSDRVVLLRTRPVMDLEATLKLSTRDIPVDNFTVNCPDAKSQCLNATACFSYIGKSVSGQHEIQYTIDLDSEIDSKGFKRVYFSDDPKYERTGKLNLTDKNVTSCVDFLFIHVENKDRLTSALNRGTTGIVFTLKYELISPPKCETDTLCAVLDKNKLASVSEQATLVLNCSDNICDYNLKVNISVDKKNVTIGKTENLQVTIELSNNDEVSYNPKIAVTHDDTLEFVSVEALNQARVIPNDITKEGGTASENYRLPGPLNKNQKVAFVVHYSTSKVEGKKRELLITARASSSSGQEKDEKDNNATISVFVDREVIMDITGTSVPKVLSYPATAPALNIKPGNDYSAVNVSAVGPKVETTFELTNTGDSDLKQIIFTVSYPLRKFKGEEHEYIVYAIAIKVKDQFGTCSEEGVVNPANLTVVKDNESRRRRKRAVETLDPRKTTSGSFSCTIKELKGKAQERFSVTFEFRLWTASLVSFYAKDLVVKIEARAEYIDSLSAKNTKAFGSVEIRVSPENPPGKSKSTPVWIIIVSVLGGVLLLAIAILALFKLGFFKRNRPPQDISSPQTDDTPAFVAT